MYGACSGVTEGSQRSGYVWFAQSPKGQGLLSGEKESKTLLVHLSSSGQCLSEGFVVESVNICVRSNKNKKDLKRD